MAVGSQKRTDLSSATVAMSFAAGSHATSTTAPECPRSTASQDAAQPLLLLLLVMRHRRMVLSAPPVAVRPSVLSART